MGLLSADFVELLQAPLAGILPLVGDELPFPLPGDFLFTGYVPVTVVVYVVARGPETHPNDIAI